MTCRNCEEQAARQAEQMALREVREGVAILAHRDALLWRSEPADVRLGDLVRVSLVAAAAEDAGFCGECDAT